MYLKPKFGIVASLFAGILGALAVMLAPDTRPSELQMREALESELSRFIVSEATMCGLVPKDGNRTDAITCARSSIASKKPFVVAFQEYGIDSDIWSGLVGDREGELQRLILDSSPSGQPPVRAEYFSTSQVCRNPAFRATGRDAIEC